MNETERALCRKMAEWGDAGRTFVVATVVRTQGSVPRKPGAKMLIPGAGEPIGTVGGGQVEKATLAAARELLAGPGEPLLLKIDLSAESACGGRVEVFLEAHRSERRIVLIGAGHVGQAVAPQLAALGWDVTVMDPRGERLETLSRCGCRTVRTEFLAAADRISFGEDLFLLIMTPDHEYDEQLAALCVERPWRWLGVMGSLRKARQIKERLLARGASPERLARLRIPVGIEIGSDTPEEIAISIAAELIRLTSRKSSGSADGGGSGGESEAATSGG